MRSLCREIVKEVGDDSHSNSTNLTTPPLRSGDIKENYENELPTK